MHRTLIYVASHCIIVGLIKRRHSAEHVSTLFHLELPSPLAAYKFRTSLSCTVGCSSRLPLPPSPLFPQTTWPMMCFILAWAKAQILSCSCVMLNGIALSFFAGEACSQEGDCGHSLHLDQELGSRGAEVAGGRTLQGPCHAARRWR